MTPKDRLISGDNHIDLTYLPARSLVVAGAGQVEAARAARRGAGGRPATGSWTPRTRACGTASARASSRTPRASFGHIDEMKDVGFEWD